MSNTRIITGIIAFIGTFAISVGLVWLFFGFPVKPTQTYSQHNCQQRHATAIYSFLQRDISNGRERDVRSFGEDNDQKYSLKTHSDSVAQYVEAMNALDASEFPQDFQIAWNKHVDAWQDYSEFLDIKKDSSKQKMNIDDYRDLDNSYNNEITETWYEVLRIGRNHGAYVRQ